MVTTQKSVSLANRLNNGEEIRCDYCKKGIYRPKNPKAAINHCFICDYCGRTYHWDPPVFVE